MKVGMIGLGAMGVHMARNLHKAGLLHTVWNRTPAKATTLASELSCAVAENVRQLGSVCDAVVICISADEDVRAVVAELAPAMRHGGLVIDCSTVSADIRQVRFSCSRKGLFRSAMASISSTLLR